MHSSTVAKCIKVILLYGYLSADYRIKELLEFLAKVLITKKEIQVLRQSPCLKES